MNNFAKAAFKKGNPWRCLQCQTSVKSKDYKTAEDFGDACLTHSMSHYGKKPAEDLSQIDKNIQRLKTKKSS
jgi:hypothetical protein